MPSHTSRCFEIRPCWRWHPPPVACGRGWGMGARTCAELASPKPRPPFLLSMEALLVSKFKARTEAWRRSPAWTSSSGKLLASRAGICAESCQLSSPRPLRLFKECWLVLKFQLQATTGACGGAGVGTFCQGMLPPRETGGREGETDERCPPRLAISRTPVRPSKRIPSSSGTPKNR